MPIAVLGILASALTLTLAWWKGGPAERGGSILVVAVWVFAVVIWRIAPIFHYDPDRGFRTMLNLVDAGIVASGFLALALRYTSWWLGFAMLAEAWDFRTIAHYLQNQDDFATIHARNGFIQEENIISFAVLAILIGGTLATWRGNAVRRRREAERLAKPGSPQLDMTLLA